jgi:VWFA-related protein
MKRSRSFRIFGLVVGGALYSLPQGTVFRSNVREVSVVFRVLDNQNRPVPGITRDEVRVDDEGVPRKITSFSADVSYSQVVVAADVSGSMAEVLEPLQAALSDFADLIEENSRGERGDVLLSLLPFSETARLLVDRTPDPKEFKSVAHRLRPSGSTALIDAILATLLNAFGDLPIKAAEMKTDDTDHTRSEFQTKPAREMTTPKRSKFLVIFTDAGENASAHHWADIASAVVGKEVVIYSVIFDSGTPDANVPKLASITRDSGGEVYRAKAEDLRRIYAQIAKNIRGHYALTFNANDVANSRTWRTIRVSTTRPDVVVLAGSGYCPETPCQKADGTFVGGSPKNWNDVLSMNRDPAVVSSVKQQLQGLLFACTRETHRIVTSLSEHPLLVERRWSTHDRGNKSYFSTRSASDGTPSVNIDSEACGITLAPEHSVASLDSVDSRTILDHPLLQVTDPVIRVSRRPTSGTPGNLVPNDRDDYFLSQAIFYLVDRSGGIRYPLKVQCNRPHFLVGDGLVKFVSEAISDALKLIPKDRQAPTAAEETRR